MDVGRQEPPEWRGEEQKRSVIGWRIPGNRDLCSAQPTQGMSHGVGAERSESGRAVSVHIEY